MDNCLIENRIRRLATLFCCKTSWSQTWSYAQQRIATCNATMLRDKLKKNVARITGPLFTCDAVKGNITFNKVGFWPKMSFM